MKYCKKCQKTKRSVAFPKENSLVCLTCRYTQKNIKKAERMEEREDLGLETLDKEKEIVLLTKYLRPRRIAKYEKAMELASKIPHKVLDDHTIYLMGFLKIETEDLLTRINVMERDRYECFYCGNDATTLDHIVPKSNGGAFTEENLVASCEECNTAKGDRELSKEEVLREVKRIKEIKSKNNKQKTAQKESIKVEFPFTEPKPAAMNLDDMINNTLKPKNKWE